MWLRALVLVAACLLISSAALAQAPPSSFYEGRSATELHALAADPKNDVLLRRGAATKLVLQLTDAGELDAAEAAGREFKKNIDPASLKHIPAVRRRRRVHLASIAALVLDLGAALASIAAAGARRSNAARAARRMAPVLGFFFVYSAVIGGGLASSYENSTPLPFLLFAAIMLPVVALFRAWSAVGSPSVASRAMRGACAAMTAVAIGFLVVEQVNAGFLEAVGLS